jgi:hypothetical protein
VKDNWSDADSLNEEPGDESVRERPGGTRHLGAARLASKYRLVRREWPAIHSCAVGDGSSEPAEELLDRTGGLDTSTPEAAGAIATIALGRQYAQPSAVGEEQGLSQATVRDRSRPIRPSDLDDPGCVVDRG